MYFTNRKRMINHHSISSKVGNIHIYCVFFQTYTQFSFNTYNNSFFILAEVVLNVLFYSDCFFLLLLSREFKMKVMKVMKVKEIDCSFWSWWWWWWFAVCGLRFAVPQNENVKAKAVSSRENGCRPGGWTDFLNLKGKVLKLFIEKKSHKIFLIY